MEDFYFVHWEGQSSYRVCTIDSINLLSAVLLVSHNPEFVAGVNIERMYKLTKDNCYGRKINHVKLYLS